MLEWEDTTGYSQGKERTPTTWTLNTGRLRITVTCGHIHYKPKWIMHCREIGIDAQGLNATDRFKATHEALVFVGDMLDEMRSSLDLPVRPLADYSESSQRD